MDEHKIIRYLMKKDLIEANNAAKTEKRNRTLSTKFIDSLSEEEYFPIIDFFYHTKNEIRLKIMFSPEGDYKFLDVSPCRFETLRIANRDKNGTVWLETEEETEARRPYPNKREWKETIKRQPLRKQKPFRRVLLEAYGVQCAICNIKNPSLLRAAHIVPVAQGGDDSVNNGICLCINHEIAFDKGILVITTEGKVICEDDDIGIEHSEIRWPFREEYYPSIENLAKKIKILGHEDKTTD